MKKIDNRKLQMFCILEVYKCKDNVKINLKNVGRGL